MKIFFNYYMDIRKISLVLLMIAFLLLLINRVNVAPAMVLSYLKGTLIVPFCIIFIFLITINTSRKVAFISMVSSIFTVLLIGILNQVIRIWGFELYLYTVSDRILESSVFFISLFISGASIARKILTASVGFRITFIILHLLGVITMLAVLFKLESHPLVKPYATHFHMVYPALAYGFTSFSISWIFQRVEMPLD